jgi:hypothetical protein
MIDTKLYPYDENPTCPKCRAINLNNADVDQGYDLIVQASDNNKHKVAFFDAHYCSGGKPLEENAKSRHSVAWSRSRTSSTARV